jgi:hypothetical protein
VWAGLNTLAVEAAPANRAGAVSFIGAWKFAGNAVAPLVWVPIYEIRTTLAFTLAGASCLVLAETVRRVTRS